MSESKETNWTNVSVIISLFTLAAVLLFFLGPVAATENQTALGWMTLVFLGTSVAAFFSLALDLEQKTEDKQEENDD